MSAATIARPNSLQPYRPDIVGEPEWGTLISFIKPVTIFSMCETVWRSRFALWSCDANDVVCDWCVRYYVGHNPGFSVWVSCNHTAATWLGLRNKHVGPAMSGSLIFAVHNFQNFTKQYNSAIPRWKWVKMEIRRLNFIYLTASAWQPFFYGL